MIRRPLCADFSLPAALGGVCFSHVTLRHHNGLINPGRSVEKRIQGAGGPGTRRGADHGEREQRLVRGACGERVNEGVAESPALGAGTH